MTTTDTVQLACVPRAYDAFRGFIVYLARYRHCHCFGFLFSCVRCPFITAFSVICHFGKCVLRQSMNAEVNRASALRQMSSKRIDLLKGSLH